MELRADDKTNRGKDNGGLMSLDWEQEHQAQEISEQVYGKWMELTDNMDEAQRRRCCLESAIRLLEGIQISLRSEQMRGVFDEMMKRKPR